jgi:hypothetical protein
MDFYILRDSNLYFTHQASSTKYTSSTTDFTDSHHICKLWPPLGPTVPCSNWITLVVDGLAPDDFLNVFLLSQVLPARHDAELKPQRVVQIREGMVWIYCSCTPHMFLVVLLCWRTCCYCQGQLAGLWDQLQNTHMNIINNKLGIYLSTGLAKVAPASKHLSEPRTSWSKLNT